MADLAVLRAALLDLYANRERSTALAAALGLHPQVSPINLAREGTELGRMLEGKVGELYRIGGRDFDGLGVGIYLALADEWHDRSAAREPFRRRVAKALIEQQTRDARWLCILKDHRPNGASEAEFILARPRQRKAGGTAIGTVRALVNLTDSSAFHLRFLADLDVTGLDSVLTVRQKWTDAFSVETVTKQFHEEFRQLRDRFVKALVDANPGHPALAGRDPARDLAMLAFGTRQLGRLLFLWFLQQKRWLGGGVGNGSTNYLLDLFTRHGGAGDGFYNDVLAPLFFDALGRSPHDARHRATLELLNTVPFLGGGLFRPDQFETELFGIAEGSDERTIRVAIPDAVFDRAQDGVGRSGRTVFGFLSGYRFTTQESTPDDQSVDPDPELLGKVFENLYQEDDRHATGAYYTPREIVHYMCRQVIDGYLKDQTAVSQETLDWLREGSIDWTVSPRLLDSTTADALHHALGEVTILDPAVGSGAFLLGAMQEIVLLRRGLEMAQQQHDVDFSDLEIAEWKRRAITHSLYGVDINPMAVEICKLRLWLSLVIDYEPSSDDGMVSLPDLDFRILAGDSLIDRMGADPFIHSLPNAGVQARSDLVSKVNALMHQVDGLKQQFEGEGISAPAARRDLARRIRRAQTQIAALQLDDAITRAQERLEALDRREAERAAGRSVPRVTQADRKAANAHSAGLLRLQVGLKEDAPFQKPFLWPVNFHDVLERGGFDIILANPPYIRQEGLDPVDQVSYAHAFKGAATGTADVYVYFYERAVQLLKQDARLAFISSNKFFQVDYGEGLREFLAQHLSMTNVIDFGHIPVFDADVMPAVVIAQNRPAAEGHSFAFARLREPMRISIVDEGRRINVQSVRAELENLPHAIEANGRIALQQALTRTAWAFVSPSLMRARARNHERGTTFGEVANTHGPTYGLKTGLNEAFIVDRLTAERLEGDEFSSTVIRTWTRGQDIGRWRIANSGLWVIAVPSSGDRDSRNPWKGVTDEAQARTLFRRASPAIHDHLSSFEHEVPLPNGKKKAGLRARADQGRWWWELRACGYYHEMGQPKMVWKDIAYTSQFAWDTDGSYLGNTCFFSGSAPKWLVAVCNSTPFEWFAAPSLTEGKDAYFRWLPSDLAKVPVPAVTPEQGMELERLVEDAEHREGAELRALEATIDDVVAELYQLTSIEREEMTQWKALRQLAETLTSIRAGSAQDAGPTEDEA